jgi:hypothetical protein
VLPVTPIVTLMAQPGLLRLSGPQAAEWFLASLAPSIEPTLYRTKVVSTVADVPAGYALRWVFATTPALVLLLAVLGAAALARSAITGKERPRGAIGALCSLGLLAALVWPMIAPNVLTRFPPRAEAALPFLAILAAVAVEEMTTRLVAHRWQSAAALVAGLSLVTYGLLGLPTASASFGLFGGGARGALAERSFPVGDGSEAAVLARAIDLAGAPRAALDSPDVPRSYLAFLHQSGRLRTRPDSGRGLPGFVLSRGAKPGSLATVTRDGAVLWSLTRR